MRKLSKIATGHRGRNGARTSSSRFAQTGAALRNQIRTDKRRQALGQVCLLYDLQDHADIELCQPIMRVNAAVAKTKFDPSHPTFLLRPDLDVLYFVCSVVFPKVGRRDGAPLSN